MKSDDIPDIHSTDARDFEEFLRGGFSPDPEIVKWFEDLESALKGIGFTKYHIEEFIENTDIDFDYTVDPTIFVEGIRICSECSWEGMVGDLDRGSCPECGNHKL